MDSELNQIVAENSAHRLSSFQLNQYVTELKRDARKHHRALGFEPQFIPGFTLHIADDGNVSLQIWYRSNGLLQCRGIGI